MRARWLLTVLGVLLLAGSVVAAVADARRQEDSRIEAGGRLDHVREAASEEIRRIVRDAAAALRTARPDEPAQTPFRVVRGGDGPASATFRIDGTPVDFLRHGGVEVLVDAPDATGRAAHRMGRILGETLRGALAARSEIGRPDADDPRYGRIALVDRRGSVVFLHPGPLGDEERELPEWERLRGSGGLQRLSLGAPGALGEGGRPQEYKDAKDRKVLGVWTPLEGGEGLRLLVEIDEDAALGAAAGWRVGIGGRELLRLQLWHGILGLALISLFGALSLWIVDRYAQLGPLVRVYGFARPYLRGIGFTVLVAIVFSAAQAGGRTVMLKHVGDLLARQGPDAMDQLVWLCWATVVLGVVMAVTMFLRDYLQGWYSTAMMNDVRLAIGRRLVVLPMGFFHRMRAGDLVARIERDVTGLRVLLMEAFDTGFLQPFILVGSLVVAFVMNWRLALVLLGLPILVVPLFRIARRIKKRAEKRQVLYAELSHVTFQILSGIKVIKAFGGERREIERLEDRSRGFLRQARRIQRLSSLSKGLMDLMQMTGGAALIYVGGVGVFEGTVTLGDLMAFMAVVQLIYNASKELTSTFNKVIEQTPAVERVFEVLDAEDTLLDGPEELPKAPLREGVALQGVRFRYLDADVLSDVDLRVPAGKVVALVGPTGAGKTTVCDLVARYYDPTAGAVLFDGRDVRRFTKKSLLRSISLVTQDAFLFNASVEENIRYGRPEATQAEVEQAARDAFVHDEILAMDGGYGKLCGERGTALSGGQRQRVTIARAILKDAPVLILDEATSNLDSHSEAQVQAALAKLMAGRTVLVVAHRLSTIRNADLVVVLEGGRIVEQGAPGDLLRRPDSRFRAMYELQMGERGRPPEE